ncbi:putative reverse transcriptase domain-containing protein [Tanacetum coccineum]
MMMRLLPLAKNSFLVCDTNFVALGEHVTPSACGTFWETRVDTPEVLLRTVALRHTTTFLKLCSLVKADIEKGEVTNISVDNIDIGDPSVEDFSWKLTQNLPGEELLQMADKGTKRKKPREGGMKREERKFKKYVKMAATAQNTNNTTIRSILQHEKLTGPNFTNWYRNLRIVLRRKDYDQFVQKYNMHSMEKTIAELHVMLKLHEKGIPKKAETPAVLAIREGKIQKDKRKSRWTKGKDKGNNKLAYAPKPKILSSPKRDNPTKDSICHHCKEVGHWRRNYSSYQAELKKRKEASMASTSGTFTIELYAEFFEDNLIVQEASGIHRPLKISRSDEGLELIQEEDTQPFENTSEEHNEVVPMEYELGDLNEPPNYKAALSDLEYDKWLEAINTEMQSMKDNQVWVLVELPPNGRTVWSIRAIRILLAIAAFYDYEIWQMDVKTAFLNGHLSEDVYMVQPEGFDEEIKKIGFTQNPNEPCVYLKASGSNVAFLVLYVDDILLMGNSVAMLQEVKSWLCKCFSMKDLGEAAYTLGIKIIRDRSKRLIAISQSAYLEKTLKKFRMENSKKGYTPMMENPDYRKSQGEKHLLSRFQQNPGEIYWTVVKTILNGGFMRKFIDGLGDVMPSNKRPMEMPCDNEPALAIAEDPEILKGARNFQRKYQYIHEVIQRGEIVHKKVHTDDNIADPFTKPMSLNKHFEHAMLIGIVPASSLIYIFDVLVSIWIRDIKRFLF